MKYFTLKEINKHPMLHCLWLLIFMSFSSFNVLASDKKVAWHTLLYQSEGITVRPPSNSGASLDRWCLGDINKQVRVEVLYDVADDQRHQRMGSNYEAFVYNTIVPAIKKICGLRVYAIEMEMKRMDFSQNLSLDYIRKNRYPIWDRMYFKITKTRAIKTAYHPEGAIGKWTQDKIDELKPKKVVLKRLEEILFKDGPVEIYPANANWCSGSPLKSPYVDVVYDMPDEKRAKWLKKQYPDFLGSVILPLIEKNCNRSSFGVAYYKKGEVDISESFTYLLISATNSSQPPKFKQISHYSRVVEAAKAQKEAAGQKKVANCPKPRSFFDSTNSAAYLGYKKSRHLLNDKNVDYYLAQYNIGARTAYSVIALHDVKDNETIIDARYTNIKSAFGVKRGIQYNNEMIAYYRDFLIPCLTSLVTEHTPLIISHYGKSNHLKRSKKYQAQSSPNLKIIPAVISTFFTNQKGFSSKKYPAMPQYISRGNDSARLGELQALTINDANLIRTKVDERWKEKQRLAKLTPADRGKEMIRLLDAKDTAKFESASKKGLISRDRFYWKQFRYADELESIFNGSINTKDRLFPHLYIGYVNFYSTRCEQTFPSGSKTTAALPRGRVDPAWYAEMAGDPWGRYKINQKHWRNYAKYWAKIDRKNSMRTSRTAKKFLGYIREDFRAMLRKENCNSAFLKQFDENISRLASGAVTLQKDGKSHIYSKGLTFQKKKKTPTLQRECYLYDEKTSTGLYKNDPRMCQCLDEHFKIVLSAQEYRLGASDYSVFRKKLGPPAKQNGDWRYNNVLNICRACKDNDYDNCMPSLEYSPSTNTYTRLLADLQNNQWVEKDRLYSTFFVHYLTFYGRICRKQLGVHELRRVISQNYDAFGPVGPSSTYETRIALAYVDAFDKNRKYVSQTKSRDYEELNYRDKPEVLRQKLAEIPFKKLKQLLTTSAVLREHFSQGCKSKAVQTVYNKLYDLEHQNTGNINKKINSSHDRDRSFTNQ